MKKAILATIFSLALCLPAMAADVVLTITVPSEKVEVATAGFLKIYPNNETVPDPNWVDPVDGTPPDTVAKYTTKQWVTEKVRRNLVRDIRRGLQMIALEASQVAEDDTIAQ